MREMSVSGERRFHQHLDDIRRTIQVQEGGVPASRPKRIKVYSDGAARGNPGPAAIAFSIYDEVGALVDSDARLIGVATNNEAEYQALILALDRARAHRSSAVHFFLDSQLVVRQVTGTYRARDARMKAYLDEVLSRMKSFGDVRISSVPRENHRIRRVDEMVNEMLDRSG